MKDLIRSILRQFANVTTLPLTGGVRRGSLFNILYFIFIISFACACANIGSPDGGAYDETPPQVLYSQPGNQAVNATNKKIRIRFNEYIKIENASEKVVVSPPQTESPNVRADGKSVRIDLFDSLQANTTYTIDFADAIVDNNEDNPMGNYTFSFSTGSTIDTMEVSGYVLNAADLEPIKGILVGLYLVNEDSIVPDSTFRTRAFDRVSRTNGSGRFVIKGVAANQRYRAFALQDMDGNFCFTQKNERIGTDTAIFESYCRPDYRLDTLWRDSTHYDSIQPTRYTHFYPDNIVIRAFLEGGQARHLLKIQRDVPERFTVFFTAPADTLPRIKGINFPGEGGFILEPSEKGDTITYWIPDTTIAYADTLAFEYSYLDTDSLGQLVWKTDPQELVPKTTRAKQLKDLQQKTEEWEKEQKKKRKQYPNKPPEENPNLITFLNIDIKPAGSIAPNQTPVITFSEPAQLPDVNALHLRLKVDSLWEDEPFEVVPLPNHPRHFQLLAEWEPGQQYRFEIDSATVRGALGHTNRPVCQDIRIRKEEEFGTLFIHVIHPDTGIVVQLLNGSDKPIATERANADGRAEFYYVKPGIYYLRCFVDSNGDGVWTTGDYDAGIPPEETHYFPQALTVKALWELNQDWEPRAIAAMRQKPAKITKQKPDKEKQIKQRNRERAAGKGK